MNGNLQNPLPWYRHRWPWLLMLGPFIVIVAAMITLWLAIRSDDGLVADDYYRQGLAINKETSRERLAVSLGIGGEVSIDHVHRWIFVELHKGKLASAPAELSVSFAHPTRSGLDQSVHLRRDANAAPGTERYSGGLTGDLVGEWNVTLEDDARTWRLSGRWDTDKAPVLRMSGGMW